MRESERRQIQKEMFHLEDEREAAEKRFRALFENALVGLFRARVSDGRFTDANREAARILGFDTVPSLLDDVNTHPERYSFLVNMHHSNRFSPSAVYSFSARTKKQDGMEFWAQFSVRFTDNGEFIEGAVKDITDQVESMERLRMAKAEAEEANAAKSRFLATISHEIRTPLNGIIGYAEILSASEGKKNFARKILDESDRLMLLINQLLDFSKLEANKISLESILFDVPEMIDEAEGALRFKIREKGLLYSRNVHDDVPRWLVGDPMRLRQILSNLLSNALKFTEEGTLGLDVSLEKVEPGRVFLRFAVSDTGIGIPPDKQASIFRSFEQADSSISRKYGGTGLGISICRELVALMGGELMVFSRENVGSTFHFTVPIDVPSETMDGVPSRLGGRLSKLDELQGKRILLVEDYETNMEIARHHLEEAGCEVFSSENGLQAVDFLKANPVDLIFMDMHMPEMDGLEATRALRTSSVQVPIIGMTASAFAEDRRNCLAAGMNDFLTKPLRRIDLLSKALDWINVGPGAPVDGSSLPAPGSSAAPVTSHGTLRYNDFLREMGGDTSLADEVIDGFAADVRRRLERSVQALSDGNLTRLHREAHSIKGGALSLMADELADKAYQLEQAAKRREGGLNLDLNGVRIAYQSFLDEWMRIREKHETDER